MISSKNKNLSIVIPVYNEEASIADTLKIFQKLVLSSDFEIEVLLVNDGSTDKTKSILENSKEIDQKKN